MKTATVRPGIGKFQQRITLDPHVLIADEPIDAGGEDSGPSPHDFLLAALGACTAMTVKMYADRKGWPLEKAEVTLDQSKDGAVHEIRRLITLFGPLTEEQKDRLTEIAEKCPVHKTLTGEIRIATTLAA